MDREYEAVLRKNLKMTGVTVDLVIQLMKDNDAMEEKLLKKSQQYKILKELNDELRARLKNISAAYDRKCYEYWLFSGDRKDFSKSAKVAYIKEHDEFPPETSKSKTIYSSTLERVKALIAFYESGEDEAMLPICCERGNRPTSEVQPYKAARRYLLIPVRILVKNNRVWAKVLTPKDYYGWLTKGE